MAVANEGVMREDPRVTRTRKLIRDALHDLMEMKSFSDVTVQDIAERATVNRATFYAHFEDKYVLLEDSARSGYRAALAEHNGAAAVEISAFLEMIARATFKFMHIHHKCRVDKEFEPPIARAMQDELYDVLRFALGESAALVVSSAMIGTAMQWRANRYNQRSEELVEQLVSVLLNGVRFQRAYLESLSNGFRTATKSVATC